ncbi:MAG: YvcK family protein [Candidatus Kaiserbacteria bacterium]|nr:MAG: YvcK family protein [Candidatus Kaiserbacteria bacterium]
MKRVVTIGGGTGSYVVLRGLKEYPLAITAVISMFDSGGSSGVLRDEFGILPPGDIRRALVALSEGKRAEILRELFNYRFENGGTLKGHNFGNLFLAALSSIYGSDIEAIRKASQLLDIKGRALPVSLDNANLHAILEDGTEIVGETNIDIPKHDGNKSIKKVFLDPAATLFAETESAIREANTIVIGPGDPYTSVIPNLLVKGMREALAASPAKKVFVCNLLTKWGETNDCDASDIAEAVLSYSGLKKFDYAICNTAAMDKKLVAAYEKEKKYPILCDDKLSAYADEVITGDFFSEADIARHDSGKIAKIISEL